jgi:sigma-E factor negative regulatory protein RseB
MRLLSVSPHALTISLTISLLCIAPHFARAENADPLVERREAQAWLKRIQLAAQKLNYTGMFVYQDANQVRTSRIAHMLDGKNEKQKLVVLDGKPREYVRTNDAVICYMPEIKVMLVEKKAANDLFPAILPSNFSNQISNYYVKTGPVGSVAGFECQALVLEPKDNLRYGYKLCAEKSTGLLLRAQTINERNEVIEQIAFTQLTLGGADRARVKSSFSNLSGWRIENAMINQTQLSSWFVNWVPPGFKKTREMRRMLSDTSASQTVVSDQREVTQIVFSDGLAAISVFIEAATSGRNEGSMQQGAMNIMSRRQGEFWITIVGEVPVGAIKQVANSIEYKPK